MALDLIIERDGEREFSKEVPSDRDGKVELGEALEAAREGIAELEKRYVGQALYGTKGLSIRFVPTTQRDA